MELHETRTKLARVKGVDKAWNSFYLVIQLHVGRVPVEMSQKICPQRLVRRDLFQRRVTRRDLIPLDLPQEIHPKSLVPVVIC